MPRMILVSFLLMMTTVTYAKDSKMEIKDTIHTYVEGYLNADKNLIAKAFYPATRLLSVDNSKIDITEMKDWFINLDERKARGDIRKADLKIESIQVTEKTAVAKINLKFEKVIFTDYLSLLELEEGWIIVGKIYSAKEL